MAALAFAPGCGSARRRRTSAVTVQVEPAAASQYVTRFTQAAAEQGRTVAVTDLIVAFGPVADSGDGASARESACRPQARRRS